MPFFLEMYEEATDKVTVAAKTEVEAFVVGAIHNAGMAALAAGQVSLTLPQLPAKDEA